MSRIAPAMRDSLSVLSVLLSINLPVHSGSFGRYFTLDTFATRSVPSDSSITQVVLGE